MNVPLTAKRLREILSYDPETGIFIRLNSTGHNVKIGETAGGLHHEGYWTIRVDGIRYPAHRLAWLYVYGQFPVNLIDHINGMRSDNRILNLRDVTNSQNLQNLRRARSDNKSTGVLGVKKVGKKFAAKIQTNGKCLWLGTFSTLVEAENAYLNAKNIYHIPRR